MKSYYLHQGDLQEGPYSINQLKKMQISPDVPVWTEGMPNWIQAQQVPELRAALFVLQPAYLGGGNGAEQGYLKSATEGMGYMVGKSWKGALVAAGIVLVAFGVFRWQNTENNSSVVSIADREKTPAEQHEELYQRERDNPGKYISGKISYQSAGNGETVVEGTLINTATMADYKNAVLVITLVSKKNSEEEKLRYVIDKDLAAGQSVSYQYKIGRHRSLESVKAAIESAAAGN